MKLKYAIIENEEFARLNLQNIIESICPESTLLFTAETIEESVESISLHQDCDVIFLDIELDDGNCFEIFRKIEVKPPVVFTTAYDEYAVKAFKVNSIDYLLKPISESDVTIAVKKLYNSMHRNRDYLQAADEMSEYKKRNRMLVCTGTEYMHINTTEIAWFEAEDKYVNIVTVSGRKIITSFESLPYVMKALDSNQFFQLSRSVVASITSISRVSKYFKGRLKVELRAGEHIRTEIISAARRNQFLEWLGHS